eukprot:TRINITY_DN4264_c0_g2_i1.p1 TRINITY_DN4264_c0_g2~~TRINITY_DN4264_c0_g2_i1.p1  ORF type:complete len:420 (-),score=70.95 TRINITY_DN4264_c0_g2_i1:87-1346(-)
MYSPPCPPEAMGEDPPTESMTAAVSICDAVKRLQRLHEEEVAKLKEQHNQVVAGMQIKHEEELSAMRAEIQRLNERSGSKECVDGTAKARSLRPALKEVLRSSPHLRNRVGGLGDSSHSAAAAIAKERKDFIDFVFKATSSRDSQEFHELYTFLLKCFTDADTNFDGRIGMKEFEHLIESAACLPRKFGYAPSAVEVYATQWDQVAARLSLFKSMHPKKGMISSAAGGQSEFEYITFSMWLDWSICHIEGKVSLLSPVNSLSRLESSKQDLEEFMKLACQSRKTLEYKELYHFLLKCFADADSNFDGLIDFENYVKLIDIAARAPRYFGLTIPDMQVFTNEKDKRDDLKRVFESLDVAGSGYLDFDTWLEYTYARICEKTRELDPGLPGKSPDVLSPDLEARGPNIANFAAGTSYLSEL